MMIRTLALAATLVLATVASAGVPTVTNSGHPLEEASTFFHDYMHDTYDDLGLYGDVIGTSHDMEEAAAELHDLLHDVADGLADPADVPAAFDAVEAAHKTMQQTTASSGVLGADSEAKALAKDVKKEFKQLRKDLKKDGLI